MAVATSTLDLFDFEDPGDHGVLEEHEAQHVFEHMRSILPAPEVTLVPELFRNPNFAVVLLKDIAQFYGCFFIPAGVRAMFENDPGALSNPNVALFIWFAIFIDADENAIRASVEMYRRSRGSPNLLLKASAPSAAPVSVTPATTVTTNISPPNPPASSVPVHVPVPVSSSARDFPSSSAPVLPAPSDPVLPIPAPGPVPAVPVASPNSTTPLEAFPPHSSPVRNRPAPSQSSPVVPGGDRPNQVGTPPEDFSPSDHARKASYVSLYFKEKPYTGSLTQSLDLYLRDYHICARQNRLSATQMGEFFINMFDGPARSYFFNNVPHSATFDEMVSIMMKNYSSDARRIQVQRTLDTLRFSSFKTQRQISSDSEALTQLVEYIDILTPQCRPEFATEANKQNYLREAVRTCSWARGPISNIVTAKYTFTEFVTALHEKIQLDCYFEEGIESERLRDIRFADPADTHIQQYGRNPRHVQKFPSRPPVTGPRQPESRQVRFQDQSRGRVPPYRRQSFAESRRKSECHRCGEPWKPGHRCRPGAFKSNIRSRLAAGETAVHLMHELVEELEGDSTPDPTHCADTPIVASTIGDDTAENPPTVPDELDVFDQLSMDPAHDTHLSEVVDQQWYLNNMASHSDHSSTEFPTHSSDFQ